MEQDSARPKTLPSHVSVGTANLVREEPMVAFPRWTLSPGLGSPPRKRLPLPRGPSLPGTRGRWGPFNCGGRGGGFLFRLSFT